MPLAIVFNTQASYVQTGVRQNAKCGRPFGPTWAQLELANWKCRAACVCWCGLSCPYWTFGVHAGRLRRLLQPNWMPCSERWWQLFCACSRAKKRASANMCMRLPIREGSASGRDSASSSSIVLSILGGCSSRHESWPARRHASRGAARWPCKGRTHHTPVRTASPHASVAVMMSGTNLTSIFEKPRVMACFHL